MLGRGTASPNSSMQHCSVRQPCKHGHLRLAAQPGRRTARSRRCCSLISPNTSPPASSAVVTDPDDHGLSMGLQRGAQLPPVLHHTPHPHQQQQHHHQPQEQLQQHQQQLRHTVLQQENQQPHVQAADAPASGAGGTTLAYTATAAAAVAVPQQRRRHDPWSACSTLEQLIQTVEGYSSRSGAFSSRGVVPALQALLVTWPLADTLPRQQQQQQQQQQHQGEALVEEAVSTQQQQQQQRLQAYCTWCTTAQQVLQLVGPNWQQLHGAWLADAAHLLAAVGQLLEATPTPPPVSSSQAAAAGVTAPAAATPTAAAAAEGEGDGSHTYSSSSSRRQAGTWPQQQQAAVDTAAAGVRAALQQVLQQQLPPPTITSALMRAATPAQLLALLQLLAPQLNGLHVTAAMVALVRLQQQQHQQQHRHQQQEVRDQVSSHHGNGTGRSPPPSPAAAAAATSSRAAAPSARAPLAAGAAGVAPARVPVQAGVSPGEQAVQLAGQLLLEGGLVQQLTAAQVAQLLWAGGRLQEEGLMGPAAAAAAVGAKAREQQQQREAVQEDGSRRAELQQQLLSTCLASAHQLQPKELVMALHGLTLLRAPLTLPQQQQLAVCLQQVLPDCSSKELGVVAWCLGQQQLRDPGSAWWRDFWGAVQPWLMTPTAAAVAGVTAAAAAPGGNGSAGANYVSSASYGAPFVSRDGSSAASSSSSSGGTNGRVASAGSSSSDRSRSSSSGRSSVLQPVEVCHVLRAAALWQQAPPPDTWQRLQHHVLQQLTGFDQQELAVLLWSWAKLGMPCSTPVLQQLAAAAGQQQESLSLQSRALVLLAAARLEQQQQQQPQQQQQQQLLDVGELSGTLEAATTAAPGECGDHRTRSSRWERLLPTLQQLQQCNVRDVVMVVHAAAQLQLELPQGWLEAALRQVCHQPDLVTPQGLLALVTAVQALQQQQQPWEQAGVAACMGQLLEAWGAVTGEQLAVMKPLPLAQLAAGLVRGSAVMHLAQINPQQQQAPLAAGASASSRGGLFQQQQQQQQDAHRRQQWQHSLTTSRTAAAAGSTTASRQDQAPGVLQQVSLPCELLRGCCGVLATQVNAWDGAGLTKLLWSLSRLGSTACLAAAPDALLEAVYVRQQQLLGAMTPQQVATSLYAIAKMGVQPAQPWVDRQLTQLSPAFSQLPGQNLAEVVAAVAAFDWAPPQAWLRSYMKALSAVAAADGMSPWQLRKVRLGLSAVAPKAAERWEQLLVARRQQEHAARRLFVVGRSPSPGTPPPAAAAAAGSWAVPLTQQQQQQQGRVATGAATATRLAVAPVDPPAASLAHLQSWLQQAVTLACDDLPRFPPAAAAPLLSSCVAAGAPAGGQLLRCVLTHGVTHGGWVTRVTPRELTVVVAAAAVYRADAAAVQRLVDAASPALLRQVQGCSGPQQQAVLAQQLLGLLYAVARLQQQYLAQHSVRHRLRRRRLLGEGSL